MPPWNMYTFEFKPDSNYDHDDPEANSSKSDSPPKVLVPTRKSCGKPKAEEFIHKADKEDSDDDQKNRKYQ
ncbi:hypothetical protein PtA15_1A30 [Puccinia triticina]|uniref:Uncharacterized protein n=1 Tax=Puccinia triticina TaxID=208348 RepID=A0ABY7C8B7_9BASI|nr:uncharacterized protein PtA15_1A30 [Puccinia triticina]WAQ80692.1 hypothetical protein PtA15_1A30 [Puccinia triticina]WAR51583.1 hypothetical protein PtB15_1B19 [Puccinia triticina]